MKNKPTYEELEQQIRELKGRERQYRQIVDDQTEFIVRWLPNGIRTFVNESYCKYYGQSRDELIGTSFFPLIDKDDLERVQNRLKDLTPDNPVSSEEHRVVLSDGSQGWNRWTDRAIFDESGNLIEYQSVGRDITDRKKIESDLQEQKSFIQDAIDAQRDTFFIFDAITGKALLWNKAFEDVSGYTNEEIAGLIAPESYYSRTDLEKAARYIESVLSGAPGTVELELVCKNGDRIPTEYSASILRDSEGTPKTMISIGRDISDRIKAEKEKASLESQLQQSHKMEAIGTLAGGIAHDFNNMLTPILGYTEMVQMNESINSESRECLAEVLNAAHRAKELVKQILTFSRQTGAELIPLQIHLVVKEALKLMRASIPTTIEIVEDIDDRSGYVLADPTQIHQVIMNLCTNAYQSMRKTGGIVSVELKRIIAEDVEQRIVERCTASKSYIRLCVTDDGPGMDQDVLEKIFEPYFTTRKKDEGTGLGLAVVHGIVRNHGGHISAYSESGTGTSFHIYLPCEGNIFDETRDPDDLPLQYGDERILVVDDDKTIARLEERILSDLGYKASSTSSANEALELFTAHPEDYDMVITDMTMPEMNGSDLCKKLLNIRPDIPLILCTGYSELINKEKSEAIGIKGFLMKPLEQKELSSLVREVLDASDGVGRSQ